MKPSSIHTVMDLARRARGHGKIFNPVFVGAPGLGKTEIIQEWCELNKLPFVVITAATYEAPDFKGFPRIEIVEGRQRQTYATPDYWPNDGEGVIILEEVNRGTTSVMNCMMSLTDKRRGFDGYKLPDKWIVAGCINPESEHYDTNTIDTALKDRLEFFEINYDRKEFLEFARKDKWNESLIMFVDSGTWTYLKPEDVGSIVGAKYIAPRTLSKLNAALLAGIPKDLELDVYEAILGKNIGSSFFQFVNDEQPILYKDIVENTKSAMKKLKKFADPENYKAGHIAITIRDIVEKNEIVDTTLAEVCLGLPADQAYDLLNTLSYKRKEDGKLLERIYTNYPEVKKYLKHVLVK